MSDNSDLDDPTISPEAPFGLTMQGKPRVRPLSKSQIQQRRNNSVERTKKAKEKSLEKLKKEEEIFLKRSEKAQKTAEKKDTEVELILKRRKERERTMAERKKRNEERKALDKTLGLTPTPKENIPIKTEEMGKSKKGKTTLGWPVVAAVMAVAYFMFSKKTQPQQSTVNTSVYTPPTTQSIEKCAPTDGSIPQFIRN